MTEIARKAEERVTHRRILQATKKLFKEEAHRKRIAELEAENERLREAFKKPDAWLITDGETYWVTGFEPHPKGHPYCEIIPLYRAALGETK